VYAREIARRGCPLFRDSNLSPMLELFNYDRASCTAASHGGGRNDLWKITSIFLDPDDSIPLAREIRVTVRS